MADKLDASLYSLEQTMELISCGGSDVLVARKRFLDVNNCGSQSDRRKGEGKHKAQFISSPSISSTIDVMEGQSSFNQAYHVAYALKTVLSNVKGLRARLGGSGSSSSGGRNSGGVSLPLGADADLGSLLSQLLEEPLQRRRLTLRRGSSRRNSDNSSDSSADGGGPDTSGDKRMLAKKKKEKEGGKKKRRYSAGDK